MATAFGKDTPSSSSIRLRVSDLAGLEFAVACIVVRYCVSVLWFVALGICEVWRPSLVCNLSTKKHFLKRNEKAAIYWTVICSRPRGEGGA